MLTNREFVLMLREMADYMEKLEMERPSEVPVPDWWYSGSKRWQFQVLSKEQMQTYVRIFGGHLKKELAGDYIELVKKLNTCEIKVWALRDRVCERVVTGTKLVKKEVPTNYEMQEVEEEIVEWHCPESLLA